MRSPVYQALDGPKGSVIFDHPYNGAYGAGQDLDLEGFERWSPEHALDNARTDQRTVDAVGAKGTARLRHDGGAR